MIVTEHPPSLLGISGEIGMGQVMVINGLKGEDKVIKGMRDIRNPRCLS
jgi:hypothetical protein